MCVSWDPRHALVCVSVIRFSQLLDFPILLNNALQMVLVVKKEKKKKAKKRNTLSVWHDIFLWLIFTVLLNSSWFLMTFSFNSQNPSAKNKKKTTAAKNKTSAVIRLEINAPASVSPFIRIQSTMPIFHPTPSLSEDSHICPSFYSSGTCPGPHMTPRLSAVVPWTNL